jgi:hypothetical protein
MVGTEGGRLPAVGRPSPVGATPARPGNLRVPGSCLPAPEPHGLGGTVRGEIGAARNVPASTVFNLNARTGTLSRRLPCPCRFAHWDGRYSVRRRPRAKDSEPRAETGNLGAGSRHHRRAESSAPVCNGSGRFFHPYCPESVTREGHPLGAPLCPSFTLWSGCGPGGRGFESHRSPLGEAPRRRGFCFIRSVHLTRVQAYSGPISWSCLLDRRRRRRVVRSRDAAPVRSEVVPADAV